MPPKQTGGYGSRPCEYHPGSFVIAGVDAHIDPMQAPTGLERADVGIGPYGFFRDAFMNVGTPLPGCPLRISVFCGHTGTGVPTGTNGGIPL